MIKKILLVLLSAAAVASVSRAGVQGSTGAAGAPVVRTSSAASSIPAADRYVTHVWNSVSGLPGSSVRALVMTGDGFIWIGTEAGLVRFDGVRFELFDQYNSPALKDSRILSLHEDALGALWVGSDGGGLCSVSGGDWRCVGLREGLRDLHIIAITSDASGRLWAGTEYGVHCFDGTKVDLFGLDEGLSNNIITALSAGPGNGGRARVWAGTMWGGLAAMEDGKVQLYDLKDGLGDLSVQSLLATPAGDVWIGTMKGLYRLSAEEKGIVPVPGIGDYPVTALCAAPDGSLLVGTMVEGLKAMTESRWIDLLPDGDLADCHVRSILSPQDGQILVGTEKTGLVRLRRRTVSSIGVAEGFPEGSVYAVLEDEPGSFWIGTESSGLCLLREGRVERVIGKENGLAGKMVRVLSKDDAGRLWVGTMDGGISIIGGGSITNITAANGLPSDNVSEILFDDGGGLWIGTERGLFRGRVERPGELSPVAGLDGQTIRALYRAGDGSIYAGTRGGLWKLSGESFVRIGGAALDAEVLSIYIGADGTIWAGTNGQGLRSISGEKVRSFTARDGLPGNFIFSITRPGPSTMPDRDDSPLWISCEAGVFTIDADSLIAFADGKSPILAPTLYDEAEGMPSSRCNGYCAPALCVSGSGTMYYPTNGGLAMFDMGSGDMAGMIGNAGAGDPGMAVAATPPKVIIEPLLVENARVVPGRNGAKGSSEEPLVFSGSVGRLEIRFTAIDWSAPEKCRFLYRLEGHDEGFTAVHPGQPRSAVYTDLPPGEYRFMVRAVGNTGLWSAEAATMAFTVKRPFYSTAWFILTVLAAAGLAAGAIVAVVRRRRIRRQGMKYSTSSITGERMDEAAETLRALMEEEKVFLDPDLTLKKLSQRLGIHYNHLSRIINEKHGESFNNFINRHRIEEAKRRLTDPAFDDKNILEIMLATGFYSKSTFNTAFRKFTGSSPSDFRKKNS